MTEARWLKVETGGIDWSLRLTADERLAPLLCSSPSVLCMVGCPLGTVVQVMVDLDQVVAGVDVDVAAGTKSQRYAPWTSGIVRSALLGIGGAVQNADTAQVSRPIHRLVQEKIAVLEKTLAAMGTDEHILAGRKVLEKELEKLTKKLIARRIQRSTSRPSKTGSTEDPNASRTRRRSWQNGRRISE